MSNTVSVIFPGQGSQLIGMGKPFYDAFPAAKEVFLTANEIVGYDLTRILFEGPEVELNSTRICQPGILVTSVAILTVLRQQPDFQELSFGPTLGLSLGEYTALVFAGALRFEDAVDLVKKRGESMQDCSDRHPSGMVSLIGADESKAREVCDALGELGVIGIANLNSPGQVVISGSKPAMEAAVARAKEFGIRRAIPLKVAGAFHSELMDDAAQRLRRDLAEIELSIPEIPIISNVTAMPTTDPEEIRKNLAEQVKAPVLFQRGIEACLGSGVSRFIEPGPNRVLCGLVGKIRKDAEATSVDSVEDLARFARLNHPA